MQKKIVFSLFMIIGLSVGTLKASVLSDAGITVIVGTVLTMAGGYKLTPNDEEFAWPCALATGLASTGLGYGLYYYMQDMHPVASWSAGLGVAGLAGIVAFRLMHPNYKAIDESLGEKDKKRASKQNMKLLAAGGISGLAVTLAGLGVMKAFNAFTATAPSK